MLRKLTLTIFMLACALAMTASAQTDAAAEKQAAIKELVALINGDNKATDIVNIMTAQIRQTEDATVKAMLDERPDLTAAERRSIEDALLKDRQDSVKRYQDKLMEKLNYNETINEIAAAAYDKYYTLEEIRDLSQFYKSPTGQKTLKLMSPIAADTMRAMQERILPKIPIILKEIEDEDRLEIQKKINARKPKPKTAARK